MSSKTGVDVWPSTAMYSAIHCKRECLSIQQGFFCTCAVLFRSRRDEMWYRYLHSCPMPWKISASTCSWSASLAEAAHSNAPYRSILHCTPDMDHTCCQHQLCTLVCIEQAEQTHIRTPLWCNTLPLCANYNETVYFKKINTKYLNITKSQTESQ